MIFGGYALAAHGLPRATGDLDAWVWVDPADVERLTKFSNEDPNYHRT